MGKKSPDYHEIPRLYLRGFCRDGTSFVWVFSREKPFNPGSNKSKHNPYRSGLKETALRKDNYAVRVADKTADLSYEIKLQQEEKKADRAIAKIRNKESVDLTDKGAIAHYIGLMKKRLTRRDLQAKPMIEAQVNNYPWDEQIRDLAYNGQFGLARQMIEAKALFQSEAGITKLLRESMIRQYINAHAELMRMTWIFQIAPENHYFVTSDNPVIYDESVGLRASTLIFPISTQIALIANRDKEGDLTYKEISPEETLKINSSIIVTADKEIYSPESGEWIYRGWTEGFVWT